MRKWPLVIVLFVVGITSMLAMASSAWSAPPGGGIGYSFRTATGNPIPGGCGLVGCRRVVCNADTGHDAWANCRCNGSYKFPVPPLYTYHWPGMYSQQLMTNYQSPWRFPPITPYKDEPQISFDGFHGDFDELNLGNPMPVKPASFHGIQHMRPAAQLRGTPFVPGSSRHGILEPMSEKMKRYYR